MDTLVAQYSRPIYESEATEDLNELLEDEASSLSLKFAMPPTAQVLKVFHDTVAVSTDIL